MDAPARELSRTQPTADRRPGQQVIPSDDRAAPGEGAEDATVDGEAASPGEAAEDTTMDGR